MLERVSFPILCFQISPDLSHQLLLSNSIHNHFSSPLSSLDFPSERVILQNKQNNFSTKVLHTLILFSGYNHQEQAAVIDKLIYTPAVESQCV